MAVITEVELIALGRHLRQRPAPSTALPTAGRISIAGLPALVQASLRLCAALLQRVDGDTATVWPQSASLSIRPGCPSADHLVADPQIGDEVEHPAARA